MHTYAHTRTHTHTQAHVKTYARAHTHTHTCTHTHHLQIRTRAHTRTGTYRWMRSSRLPASQIYSQLRQCCRSPTLFRCLRGANRKSMASKSSTFCWFFHPSLSDSFVRSKLTSPILRNGWRQFCAYKFLVVILHHGCAGTGAGACVGFALGAQCSLATAYM